MKTLLLCLNTTRKKFPPAVAFKIIRASELPFKSDTETIMCFYRGAESLYILEKLYDYNNQDALSDLVSNFSADHLTFLLKSKPYNEFLKVCMDKIPVQVFYKVFQDDLELNHNFLIKILTSISDNEKLKILVNYINSFYVQTEIFEHFNFIYYKALMTAVRNDNKEAVVMMYNSVNFLKLKGLDYYLLYSCALQKKNPEMIKTTIMALLENSKNMVEIILNQLIFEAKKGEFNVVPSLIAIMKNYEDKINRRSIIDNANFILGSKTKYKHIIDIIKG